MSSSTPTAMIGLRQCDLPVETMVGLIHCDATVSYGVRALRVASRTMLGNEWKAPRGDWIDA